MATTDLKSTESEASSKRAEPASNGWPAVAEHQVEPREVNVSPR